jgi:hypothetical protein
MIHSQPFFLCTSLRVIVGGLLVATSSPPVVVAFIGCASIRAPDAGNAKLQNQEIPQCTP